MDDMKMTPMALTKKEAKADMMPSVSSAPKAPRFPWGLSLSLDAKSLEKLGIKALPKVGSYVMIEAHCCVKSVRESENIGGGKDRSVELQVESMMVEPAKAKSGKAVGKGYKKGAKEVEPDEDD